MLAWRFAFLVCGTDSGVYVCPCCPRFVCHFFHFPLLFEAFHCWGCVGMLWTAPLPVADNSKTRIALLSLCCLLFRLCFIFIPNQAVLERFRAAGTRASVCGCRACGVHCWQNVTESDSVFVGCGQGKACRNEYGNIKKQQQQQQHNSGSYSQQTHRAKKHYNQVKTIFLLSRARAAYRCSADAGIRYALLRAKHSVASPLHFVPFSASTVVPDGTVSSSCDATGHASDWHCAL